MSSKKKELSFSLSDLNILILGAKLGIGASLARICAEQNANVILVDKEEPTELADNLKLRQILSPMGAILPIEMQLKV